VVYVYLSLDVSQLNSGDFINNQKKKKKKVNVLHKRRIRNMEVMKMFHVCEVDNNSVRFNIFRTVHLPIILVDNQFDAQCSIIYLFI
jgi:hypothetical protein